MRLHEFANPEEQLGLLRLIIDNTWSAVAQQAAQKKQADAEKKAMVPARPRRKAAVAKAKPALAPTTKNTKQNTQKDSAQPKTSTDAGTSTKTTDPPNTATAALDAEPVKPSKPLPTSHSNSTNLAPEITAAPQAGLTHQSQHRPKPEKKNITANNPIFT